MEKSENVLSPKFETELPIHHSSTEEINKHFLTLPGSSPGGGKVAKRAIAVGRPRLGAGGGARHWPRRLSPFLSGLSFSLSVLRRLVPLLLARLRLRQTCYVITVGAHSVKFSVSPRVVAALARVPRTVSSEDCAIRPVCDTHTQCIVYEPTVEIV
ncbi:hypothetical protein EVAR_29532_1 [Eumeta japonica]|uniref:Uncharacterized protein n=1 Tax=Eumeta variegata TaxID=151549 RepID=A0A4C1WHS7_EUMVA|nr:hypothetical protein EVAR_29532_1 [Eumeta japonica]